MGRQMHMYISVDEREPVVLSRSHSYHSSHLLIAAGWWSSVSEQVGSLVDDYGIAYLPIQTDLDLILYHF